MRPRLALQVLLLAGSFVSCRAQDKAREETAIRQFVDQFARSENSRNAEQLSQLFAADGDVVVHGQVLARGRDAIKKLITPRIPWSEIGPANYKVENVRLLNADVAIVDAQRTAYSSTFVRSSEAVFVLVKEGSTWKLASYRNFQAGPHLPPDSPFGTLQPNAK